MLNDLDDLGYYKRAAADKYDVVGCSSGAGSVHCHRHRTVGAAGKASGLRQRGKLIHELEGDVAQAYQERFAAIRDGRRPAFHSRSLDGVAGDYAALAEEILGRLQSLEGGQR